MGCEGSFEASEESGTQVRLLIEPYHSGSQPQDGRHGSFILWRNSWKSKKRKPQSDCWTMKQPVGHQAPLVARVLSHWMVWEFQLSMWKWYVFKLFRLSKNKQTDRNSSKFCSHQNVLLKDCRRNRKTSLKLVFVFLSTPPCAFYLWCDLVWTTSLLTLGRSCWFIVLSLVKGHTKKKFMCPVNKVFFPRFILVFFHCWTFSCLQWNMVYWCTFKLLFLRLTVEGEPDMLISALK